MSDFSGTSTIVINPTDDTVPYSFAFTPCTSTTANDGAIPYGTSVSSATVKAYKRGTNADVTTEMVVSSSELSNVVTANLQYPATSKSGMYYLTFTLTLDTGATMEFDFNRVKVKD